MKVCLAEMKHLASYQEYLAECYAHGLQKYQAVAVSPKSYLESIIAYEQGQKLPSNMPETASYFCLIDDEVVGTIRYRRGSSPFIERVIGHTGYDTKPSARGKGVAKFMLSWLQEQVLTKAIIVTCEHDNIASQKVIEHCGGKFINQIYSTEKSAEVLRFNLPAKKACQQSEQSNQPQTKPNSDTVNRAKTIVLVK
jgi:predicted acetyltransferase